MQDTFAANSYQGVAVMISTSAAVGSSIVADVSSSHERGKKNGWWSVGYVLGRGAFLWDFYRSMLVQSGFISPLQ